MSNFKLNLTLLSLSNIYTKCTSILLIPLMARRLSVEEFGVFGLCQTILGYVLSLFDSGIKKTAIKNLSALDDEKLPTTINHYFSLRMLMLILGFLMMNILGFFLFKDPSFRLVCFIIALSLLPQIFDITWTFDAKQDMKWTTLSRVIERTIYLVIALYALYVMSFNILALAFPISYLISVVIIWLYYKNFSIHLYWDKQQLNHLKQGFIIGLSSIMGTLCLTMDQLMIKHMLGPEELGLYVGGTKIFFVVITFGWVYSYALFPVLSKLYHDDQQKLQTLFSSYTIKLGLTICLIALLLIIFAKPIISLILSEKYLTIVPVFKVLSLFLITTFMNILYADSFNAFGMENKRLMITITALLFNIILNAIFIPMFGLIAAAWSTTASQILILAWSYHIINQRFHFQTGRILSGLIILMIVFIHLL